MLKKILHVIAFLLILATLIFMVVSAVAMIAHWLNYLMPTWIANFVALGILVIIEVVAFGILVNEE